MSINKKIEALEMLLIPSGSNSYLSLVHLCTEVPKCRPIDIPLITVVHTVLNQVHAEELPAENHARVDLVVVQLGHTLIQQITERLTREQKMTEADKDYLKRLVRRYHDAFPQYKKRTELKEIFEDFA